MPRYQVTVGSVLPHHGQVLEAGAYVELPRHVADDPNIRGLVQEIDADGHPVPPPAWPGILVETWQPHERIGLLQAALVDAKAHVAALEAQLAAESPEPVAPIVGTPAASRGVKE